MKKLRGDGYFLFDACEYPLRKNDDRNAHIRKNLPDLIERLRDLRNDKMKIVLIKNNVFYILNGRLRKLAFNVLNRRRIGFPRYYNDKKTVNEIRSLLRDKSAT